MDQAAWVVVGHVMEMDVARQGAEEGDAVANEHGDASDDEAVNEASAQKLLNGDAASAALELGEGVASLIVSPYGAAVRSVTRLRR